MTTALSALSVRILTSDCGTFFANFITYQTFLNFIFLYLTTTVMSEIVHGHQYRMTLLNVGHVPVRIVCRKFQSSDSQ